MVENFINYLFKDLKCFNDLPIKEQYIGKGFQKPLKRKNDVFLSTMGAETFVTDKLIRENQIVTEALTSPTAHRDYDYERLEFLGDSIISFLVILELYLTKE
jgi:dsRNA-specific ribonuclease